MKTSARFIVAERWIDCRRSATRPRCEIARRCSMISRYDPRLVPLFRWSILWAGHDRPSSSTSRFPIYSLICRSHATTSTTTGSKMLKCRRSWSTIRNPIYNCWRGSGTSPDCSTWVFSIAAAAAASFFSSFGRGRSWKKPLVVVCSGTTGNCVRNEVWLLDWMHGSESWDRWDITSISASDDSDKVIPLTVALLFLQEVSHGGQFARCLYHENMKSFMIKVNIF